MVFPYAPYDWNPGDVITEARMDNLETQFASILALLTTRGDLPYRGAATWERLAKGTENYYLKQGANDPYWATAPTNKLLTHTRALGAADGDVAYTGYGFQPRALIIVAATTAISVGIGDVNLAEYCIYVRDAASGVVGGSANIIDILDNSAAEGSRAVLKTLDADGFTLTWTKVGACSHTATFGVLAFA